MFTSHKDHPGRAARTAGRVIEQERLGELLWLTVNVPGWSGASPGQFALLHPDTSGCFLPRAFSVAAQTGDEISFLISPIGAGTRELEGLAVGDLLWVTGPLGNGFDVQTLVAAPSARIVIVAGGVGAAPFPLLLRRLAELQTGSEIDVLVLLGFRTQAQAHGARPVTAAASRLAAAGGACRVEIATEDGSNGVARLVTDLLAAEVRPGDRVVVCGPAAMSKAVWQVCRRVPEIAVWFSMETPMACGVGSCHGCAITLANGSIARVCHDGPVFGGSAVYGETER